MFRDINVLEDFSCNPFQFFTPDGLLLAAGDSTQSNAMTISWGALGTLWGGLGVPTVTVYVAEKRYTKQFMDRARHFSVMQMPDEHVLSYMGSHSGRNGDKALALGLHTLYTENGTPYYQEADLVLECRVLYSAPFAPERFKDDIPRKFYANFESGLHTLYIGWWSEPCGRSSSPLQAQKKRLEGQNPSGRLHFCGIPLRKCWDETPAKV